MNFNKLCASSTSNQKQEIAPHIHIFPTNKVLFKTCVVTKFVDDDDDDDEDNELILTTHFDDTIIQRMMSNRVNGLTMLLSKASDIKPKLPGMCYLQSVHNNVVSYNYEHNK